MSNGAAAGAVGCVVRGEETKRVRDGETEWGEEMAKSPKGQRAKSEEEDEGVNG